LAVVRHTHHPEFIQATPALITHSWTHITSVDTILRQTSCRGRDFRFFRKYLVDAVPERAAAS
jgi:hypothetical protein